MHRADINNNGTDSPVSQLVESATLVHRQELLHQRYSPCTHLLAAPKADQQQQPRHNFTFYFVCAIDSIRYNCCIRRLRPRLVCGLAIRRVFDRPSALHGEMVKYVIAASSRALFARRTGFGGHHHH